MAASQATFAVVLSGPTVSPEKVTVRTLSEILSAVQTLVSGRDLDDDEEAETAESEVDALSLLDVKRGSAVFPCLARRPNAVDNLRRVGRFLHAPETTDDDRFAYAIRPAKVLSGIARHLECSIEIREFAGRHRSLATIKSTTYMEVSKSLLVSGPTTVSGTVQRVGGATNMRCALRVPSRDRLLFCDVGSSEVSRKLGERLYQDVVVSGMATWFQRTWTLYTLRITEMRPLRRTRITDAVKSIYEAGGKGWDVVKNVDETIRELRT